MHFDSEDGDHEHRLGKEEGSDPEINQGQVKNQIGHQGKDGTDDHSEEVYGEGVLARQALRMRLEAKSQIGGRDTGHDEHGHQAGEGAVILKAGYVSDQDNTDDVQVDEEDQGQRHHVERE